MAKSTNFGREVSCTDSIRSGQFASGSRLVAQAVYRRLITPRGSLRGGEAEADYGFDISQMIGSLTTRNAAAVLSGMISNEITKDERIETVDVKVTQTRVGPGTAFDVSIKGLTADGTFKLQLRVSEVTVSLLGLSSE